MHYYFPRIRALREGAGYTQRKVCSDLNLDQSTLCKYESGRRRVPVEVLFIFAEYYNVSIGTLMDGKEPV